MAEITAALVKTLRDRTNAGMMVCKRALAATGGDLDAAVDWLRTKGLMDAEKKAHRTATDGLVGVMSMPHRAAMVEVNAETDFVARNPAFQAFVQALAQIALTVGDDLEGLRAAAYPGTPRTVQEELAQLVASVGENITLRRARVIEAPVVATYTHLPLVPGLGSIGVLVGLDGTASEALGRRLGMHIAATRPTARTVEDLDPEVVTRERAILTEQARASGKPERIIEAMVQGRLRSFFETVVLSEQAWVHDPDQRLHAVLAAEGARVQEFARFQVGEGLA